MKALALLLAVTACAAGSRVASGEDRLAEAATWAIDACPAAYEQLFEGLRKVEPSGESEFPTITIALGGEWTLDTCITLTKPASHLRAHVLQVYPQPLCDQLVKFKVREPTLDLEDLLPRVRTRRATVSSADHPELVKHIAALEELEIRAWPSDSLILPSRSVQLTIVGIGSRLEIEYSEPDPAAQGAAYTRSPSPPDQELAAWVRALLQILDIETSSFEVGE